MKRVLSFVLALLLCGLLCVPSFAAGSAPAAAKVAAGSANLNVRTGPSTSYAVAAKLKSGTWVTLLEQSGSWWRIQFGEQETGYCHGDYLAVRAASYRAVVQSNGHNLNVRKGAGTDYAVKAKLPDGETVAVLSESNGWSRILYHGTALGYVSSRYLTASAAEIRLDVPYFSQTDARWKDVAVGTTGGTIGTIGCTTTCLAMTESFRKGTTVTPKAMASSLRYMAGGTLYWPSDYTTQAAGEQPLRQLLDVLQTGKPVIYGSKKANGTQHWCVVTGWNGSALTAASFTIHDPASVKRTTLADFTALYPTAYKLAWYR